MAKTDCRDDGEPRKRHGATTRILVKLVEQADFPAASESALVLAKFGITLLVFLDRGRMNKWLAAVRDVGGLSVQALKSLEVHRG